MFCGNPTVLAQHGWKNNGILQKVVGSQGPLPRDTHVFTHRPTSYSVYMSTAEAGNFLTSPDFQRAHPYTPLGKP